MFRTLFLKIFVWFWLAMAFIVLAILVATDIAQPDQRSAPSRNVIGNMLVVTGKAAANLFERDGRPALVDYLEHLERTAHIQAVLYDERGEELSGRPAPRACRDLLDQIKRNGRVQLKAPITMITPGQHVFAVQAGNYVLVAEMHRALFEPLRREPRAMLLRLMTVLLTAGLLCYGLARYLTAPITKLRTATKRLADGNLYGTS